MIVKGANNAGLALRDVICEPFVKGEIRRDEAKPWRKAPGTKAEAARCGAGRAAWGAHS